jgi:hypothetical protein
VRRLDTRLSAFRFLAFFRSFLGLLEARIVRMPAATAGISDEDRCGERNVSSFYLMP